ncbi:MAG: TenA family transcriptional regulator [Halobacteriovorax sp.]|nr:TenA family transcriptional regulator [Halobacteriovorax sp.]
MTIEKLNARLEYEMENLSRSPNLEKVLEPGFVDKRLYAMYLCETYHYTLHNARNQALVATRRDTSNIQYMKYCLKHALEETGHEMMALHDLKNLGFDVSVDTLPKPLMSTETLVAYLYHISEHFSPVARLGYSYWAERSYEFIQPLLAMLSDGIGVPKKAMTFFNEHSEIDAKHTEEVEESIRRFVKSDEDWSAVEEVMVGSLILTTRMMDEVFDQFCKLKEGKSTRYKFLG